MKVLILVLMEYPQRVLDALCAAVKDKTVLILVLMEYPQRELTSHHSMLSTAGLNPCFNGISSKRTKIMNTIRINKQVLILVLMEYPQRVISEGVARVANTCLNPCFNGISSKSTESMYKQIRPFSLNPCFNGISSKSYICKKVVKTMKS